MFHAAHEGEVVAAVDVWRRPYSFLGDAPGGKGRIRNNSTWHKSLLDYTDGTEAGPGRFCTPCHRHAFRTLVS